MKTRSALGFLGGILLFLSGVAHAFLGWPPFQKSLEEMNVSETVVAPLSIGWYFGSAAMLTFGLLIVQSANALLRRREHRVNPGPAIALCYICFGVTAFVVRDFALHFLTFVGMGILVLLFALPLKRDNANTEGANSQ
jgi:hypothetical protein